MHLIAEQAKPLSWKMRPLHDVVIIRPYRQVASHGGILIPRGAEEFHEDMGEIIACGPGKLNDENVLLPMFVSVGDMVMFSTHGHQVTKVEGEELIVLHQDSIIAVMTNG
jgi:chaperonin GroES